MKRLKKTYQEERSKCLSSTSTSQSVIDGNSIRHLPLALQRYMEVCGFLGTPLYSLTEILWSDTEFKLGADKPWKAMSCEQVNTASPLSRIAYMKFKDMPVSGRDKYMDGEGEMKIRLFDIIPMATEHSAEISLSSLVTILGESLFVPASIVNGTIKWEEVSPDVVQGTISDHGMSVTGKFHFDENGLFRLFESNDRFCTMGKHQYAKMPFIIAIDSYQQQDQLVIPEQARVMWHMPDGVFEYFKGRIERISFK